MRQPGSHSPRHPTFTAATRLTHAALALAVIAQLVTSLAMEADDGGDGLFGLHQYVGLSAFCFTLLFWLVALTRHRGTPPGQLIPWFSAPRRAAFLRDLMRHLKALPRLRFPDTAGNPDADAFASAVHGLGLLLITAMAVSGTLYYFVNTGDPDAGGLVGLAMLVHSSLANLAWAYLIGHAAMAVLHHFGGRSLGRMWGPGASGAN